MYKLNFINLLEQIILDNQNSFRDNKPAIRQLFNDMKDSLYKDNELTDAQADNWILRDDEMRYLLSASKRV